jgi:transcriptional regulator with XRE-family HTH domain
MDLKTYLKIHRLKRKELAEKIGSSVHAISYYINGKRAPCLEMTSRIVEVTNGEVTVHDLLATWESFRKKK